MFFFKKKQKTKNKKNKKKQKKPKKNQKKPNQIDMGKNLNDSNLPCYRQQYLLSSLYISLLS